MSKVLVVGSRGYSSYYTPFQHIGPPTGDEDEMEAGNVALVVFTGGEDVSPYIYGESSNPKTGANAERDEYEKGIFERARKLGLPIAGICRGSQFICAMSGGKLVQHLNGHGRYHDLKTDDGRKIWVSSTHHQMQLPPDDAIPVAWSDQKLSNVYEGPPGVFYDPDREHDCVFYPKTNALGMQYHPEYMNENTPGFKYAGELVERFFKLKKTQ